MSEKVTLGFDGTEYELDIAKMNTIIDDLSKKWEMSSVVRSMEKGQYMKVIERIAKRFFEEDDPTPKQMKTVILEMI